MLKVAANGTYRYFESLRSADYSREGGRTGRWRKSLLSIRASFPVTTVIRIDRPGARKSEKTAKSRATRRVPTIKRHYTQKSPVYKCDIRFFKPSALALPRTCRQLLIVGIPCGYRAFDRFSLSLPPSRSNNRP